MKRPAANFTIGQAVHVESWGRHVNGEILDVEWDRSAQCYTYVVGHDFGSGIYCENEIS